jgi:hypothetical protein
VLKKISGHFRDLPIDTLDFNDLLLQWKVMKSLGYKSLFDPDFRREIRNPVRKFFYYSLVIREEKQDKKFWVNLLTNVSDNISFHTDPELYRKVKNEIERKKIDSGDEETINKVLSKSSSDFRKYRGMSGEDMDEALSLISK